MTITDPNGAFNTDVGRALAAELHEQLGHRDCVVEMHRADKYQLEDGTMDAPGLLLVLAVPPGAWGNPSAEDPAGYSIRLRPIEDGESVEAWAAEHVGNLRAVYESLSGGAEGFLSDALAILSDPGR